MAFVGTPSPPASSVTHWYALASLVTADTPYGAILWQLVSTDSTGAPLVSGYSAWRRADVAPEVFQRVYHSNTRQCSYASNGQASVLPTAVSP